MVLELGTVTIVDLLDAQKRLYRAVADEAKARHAFVRTSGSLYQNAGVLDDRRMNDIGAWMEPRARTPAASG